jgi:hypothetical protein
MCIGRCARFLATLSLSPFVGGRAMTNSYGPAVDWANRAFI